MYQIYPTMKYTRCNTIFKLCLNNLYNEIYLFHSHPYNHHTMHILKLIYLTFFPSLTAISM